MQHWIYGTTFNNVQTVEESIASVYTSDSSIAIVDAFSTDGTYEKLLSLKKEYNLKLSRARCTRGRGRDIALRMCPSDSYAAYIDLDAIYNQNFKRILQSEEDRTLVWQHHSQTAYFSKVESAIRAGGFRDLNGSETLEFAVRAGVEKTLPVQVGTNMKYAGEKIGGRERRYASGLNTIARVARHSIDTARGQGLSKKEFIDYHGYSRLPLYYIAKAEGIYRMLPGLSNIELFMVRAVETLCDHSQFGIGDDRVAFPVPYPLFEEKGKADGVFAEKWKHYRKFQRISPGQNWGGPVLRNREFFVYVINEEGLLNYIAADPYGKMYPHEFEEVA